MARLDSDNKQPDSKALEGRSTLINAAITLILMAILAIIAFLVKLRSKGDGTDVAGGPKAGDLVADPADLGAMVGSPRHQEGDGFPTVLPNCDLVENRANDGDSFRIRYGGQERVFDLYLADCPEITLSYPEKLQEQSEYFGGASQETIVHIGEEAKVYALNLLRACKFSVFTHWEQVRGTPRYYAFIVVEHKPGRRCFLSELLVLKGFAKPVERMVTMPAGVSDFPTFRRTMTTYEQRARREKNGGWGIVAGRPIVRQAIVPTRG